MRGSVRGCRPHRTPVWVSKMSPHEAPAFTSGAPAPPAWHSRQGWPWPQRGRAWRWGQGAACSWRDLPAPDSWAPLPRPALRTVCLRCPHRSFVFTSQNTRNHGCPHSDTPPPEPQHLRVALFPVTSGRRGDCSNTLRTEGCCPVGGGALRSHTAELGTGGPPW